MPDFIWKQVSKDQAEAAQSLGFDVELRFYAQLPKGTKLPRGEVKGLTLSTSHASRKRRPRNIELRLTAKQCEIREGSKLHATYLFVRNCLYGGNLKTHCSKAKLKELVAKEFEIAEPLALTRVSDLLRHGYLAPVETEQSGT